MEHGRLPKNDNLLMKAENSRKTKGKETKNQEKNKQRIKQNKQKQIRKNKKLTKRKEEEEEKHQNRAQPTKREGGDKEEEGDGGIRNSEAWNSIYHLFEPCTRTSDQINQQSSQVILTFPNIT